MQHINWDNLRFVLAVANQGSVAAAARELGVNRSTVLRRIGTFQENLNCRIFEQTSSGYALTPQAERMIQAAREVENTLYDMQREVEGSELRLEGELRVTTTESFMLAVLGPVLAGFQAKHPKIVVDVLVSNSVLDLNRRDADVAVRPTGNPESGLVGKRICDIPFGVYASRELADALETTDWTHYRWVGMDSSLRTTPPGLWFDAKVPGERICLRSDSFVSIRVAVEHGIGVGLLPRFLGDDSDHLVRVPGPSVDKLTIGLWALTHPDLARSARVRAFIEHVTASLSLASWSLGVRTAGVVQLTN
ncbi:MAG: LysR family transcriptional regulator [Pseudomonadota bacterium]